MSCSCKLFAAHLLFDAITEQINDDDDDDDDDENVYTSDSVLLQTLHC